MTKFTFSVLYALFFINYDLLHIHNNLLPCQTYGRFVLLVGHPKKKQEQKEVFFFSDKITWNFRKSIFFQIFCIIIFCWKRTIVVSKSFVVNINSTRAKIIDNWNSFSPLWIHKNNWFSSFKKFKCTRKKCVDTHQSVYTIIVLDVLLFFS